MMGGFLENGWYVRRRVSRSRWVSFLYGIGLEGWSRLNGFFDLHGWMKARDVDGQAGVWMEGRLVCRTNGSFDLG